MSIIEVGVRKHSKEPKERTPLLSIVLVVAIIVLAIGFAAQFEPPVRFYQ
jgi:hypothetical protein